MTEIKLLPDIITNGTLSDSCIIPIVDPANNALYSVSVGDLKAYVGSSAPPPPANNNIELTYASNGDDNGLFYWLGSVGKTASWSNPHDSGKITVTQSSQLQWYLYPKYAVNRGGNGAEDIFHSRSESTPPWIQFLINEPKKFTLKRWSYQARTDYNGNITSRLIVSVSSDGVNFIQVDDQSFSLSQSQWYLSPSILTAPSAKIIRFTCGDGGYLTGAEIELYGTLSPE